jgi:superfamily I DNA/RNA helicase
MSREIWLGPILNRNRERLLARCRDLLRRGRGREFVYLAATKPLMEHVSARLLDDGVAGTIDQLNVYLLSGFSRRVFARARFADNGEPVPHFAPIDTDLRPVQAPLFSRILSRLAEAGELASFGQLARSDGLVQSMVSLVAEIQRAGKTAADFRAVVERREALDAESKPTREPGSNATLDYDRDTALVYEHYERVLDDERLTDASRDYLRALAVLQGEFLGRPVRVPFVDEARLLVVDGFFDLLPIHAELVALLVRRFPESIVNLNFDEANPTAFAAFRDVVERFGARSGFVEVRADERHDVAEGLAPLRTDLFNPAVEPPAPDAAEVENVVAVVAPDRLREVRAAAKEIKRLVVDEGLLPDEIAVVYRSRDRYEPILREVFADEGVAVSLGERRALTDLPSARAAMKLLDAAISNRSREGRQIRIGRLVSLLKSDYFALSPAGASDGDQASLPFDVEHRPAAEPALTPDDVENAVAFVGAELNLGDWLRRSHRLIARLAGDRDMRHLAAVQEVVASDDAETHEERQSRARPDFPVDVLRKATGVLEAVSRVVLSIPYEAPAAELATAFRSALARLEFAPRLYAAARTAALDETDLRRAALDLRGLEGLERAVDAVVEASRLASRIATPKRVAGDTRLTRAEFRSDLHRAMEAHKMIVAPETEGAVRVLAATDVRGMTFAAVFVLGLVEGEFPERARGDWIYPQSERDNLKEAGLALEDISPEESLRAEEHYFYQVACRATGRLYLCRPLAGDDDAETIPSYFLAEIERAIGGPTREARATPGFNAELLCEATTAAELARSVARARRIAEDEPARCPAPRAVLDALARFAMQRRPGAAPILTASAERRIDVEHRREIGGFDEYDGLVANDLLRHRLAHAFAAHVFSASELNEFGNCGYRFFLKRVLGLTPRVEAALDLQALETGILLHEVLRRFFERYRDRPLADAPPAELHADLDAACDLAFDAFERTMPPLNPKLWRIERRMLGILLDRVLDDEIELQSRLVGAAMRPRYLEIAFGMPNVDADPESAPDPLVLFRIPGDPTSDALKVRGQIDRVDASADGRLVAYDYKTSYGPRLVDMQEGRDVQIGIYLAALEQLFATEGEVVAGGGYYTLRPTAARRNSGLYRADMRQVTDIHPSCGASLDPERFVGLREAVRENVFVAFDRIRDGDFRLAPSQDDASCTRCDYAHVCRFERHRIAGKKRSDGVTYQRPLRPLVAGPHRRVERTH